MADTTLPQRPLPLGAFPLPFGYLLVPPGEDTAAAREALLAGRLPSTWPDSMAGHALALSGAEDEAVAAFAGDDVVSRYNRLVLDPDAVDPDRVRHDLGPELGVVVDLLLYANGRSDDVPDPGSCDAELAALALSAQAADAVHGGRRDAAIALLTQAVDAAEGVSPALAGVLYGAVGQICREAEELDAAGAALKAGIALLAGTDLVVGCAELHLELAQTYHAQAGERRDLHGRAVHHYHSALQLVDLATAPELFAAAHANLATAYLTMPMVEASDQLRLGVAVASLRAALTVYTPETHPLEWASTQLNLANSMVYAPSTHQADNLVEAVDLYEAVLQARDRHSDPLAYARVLANQGNALAHLGMFEHARGKLVEARFVFEEFHEYDAASSVRGLLDEIARTTVMAEPAPACEAAT